MYSTALKNVFYNDTTLKTNIGCSIEYNMNSMIDGVTVVSATSDTTYISNITGWSSGKANPFKKLFPVDSIIKPFRPLYPGVKYYIQSTTDTPTNSFLPFRTVQYTGEGKNVNVTGAKPRVYYPGLSTTYKYWLGAKNANVDLTVQYLQTSETWAAAGRTETIPVGNKAALANKIVLKFEKYHQLPSQYRLTITPLSGSAITTTYTAPPSDGIITHYWNGTNWSTTSLTEPYSYSEPQLIKSIKLEATNANTGGYIGVIELSARWTKDISSDIVSLDITKDASASSEDLLPVGNVTANSLNISLNKYNQSALSIFDYNRSSAWTTNPTTANSIYMFKNAELIPYFTVYHDNGTLGTSPNKFDKVYQGSYFIDSWRINQYGDTDVLAIDGSKYLMEIFCPDLLCEGFPVTAILRNLLDSVGFTNYNFNLNTNDTSIPLVNYWWTEDSKTVWEAIQELCRDIQMNAVFDENNILQFYSREYIYSSERSIDWNFYHAAEGSILPNIIDFTKKEITSANIVKVLWQNPITSNYLGNSGFLWESPVSFLSAGGLKLSMSTTSDEFVVDFYSIDRYSNQQSLYNFNGYVLIDSEIIEFDAIGYDLIKSSGIQEHVWVTSQADVSKYRSLASPGSWDYTRVAETAYFKPSGRYRIKKDTNGTLVGRGALGTKVAAHENSITKPEGWVALVVSQS